MLNILPKQQKDALKKEYVLRRYVVWAGLVLSALIISLVLLVPSYLLSRVRLTDARVKLEQTKAALDSKSFPIDVATELSAATRNAQDLRPFVKQTSPHDLIKIFETKPNTIKLTEIHFGNRPPAQATIFLKGIAANRESLTNFGRLMEARTEFSKVDLPVSNFAREKDIVFSMTIEVK